MAVTGLKYKYKLNVLDVIRHLAAKLYLRLNLIFFPIVPDPSTGNETSYDNETIFDIYDATNCPIVIPEEKSLIENRLRLLMYIGKISLTFFSITSKAGARNYN